MFKFKIIIFTALLLCCSNKKLLYKKNKAIAMCILESEKKDIIINKLYKEVKTSREENKKFKSSFNFFKANNKEKIKICRNKVLHYKVLLDNIKERNKILEESSCIEEVQEGGC